jgi:hypothetical protein
VYWPLFKQAGAAPIALRSVADNMYWIARGMDLVFMSTSLLASDAFEQAHHRGNFLQQSAEVIPAVQV